MAAPTSAHLLRVGDVWYDLRKIISWAYADDYAPPSNTGTPNTAQPGVWVRVNFGYGSNYTHTYMDRATFEAAKTASLAAGG